MAGTVVRSKCGSNMSARNYKRTFLSAFTLAKQRLVIINICKLKLSRYSESKKRTIKWPNLLR